MADQTYDIPEAKLQNVFQNPDLLKLYANGFMVGRTETDMFIVPLLNSQPVAFTSMSFHTAKKFITAFQKQLDKVEKDLGKISIKAIPKSVNGSNTENLPEEK